MSGITFESKSRSVSVRGSERFYAGYVTGHLTSVFLDIGSNKELLVKAIPAFHHLRTMDINSPQWDSSFEASFYHGSLNLEVGGKKINGFHLSLNTASAIGDDAVKMLARIHAQCEIHGFVAGNNRAWMADILAKGSVEVFRPDSGWAEVVELLRESDDGPVVMSYSITDDFLSTASVEWVSDRFSEQDIEDPDAFNENGYTAWQQAEEDWYDLDRKTKWDYAQKWLNANASKGLEITPEAWPITFGPNGMTAGKLVETLRNQYIV